MNIKSSHIFLAGLLGVGAYVGYKEYTLYKRRKLIEQGIDPLNPTGPRTVFEVIGSQNPTAGQVVVTVPSGAGLPSCDTFFTEYQEGALSVFRPMLVAGARASGKCA